MLANTILNKEQNLYDDIHLEWDEYKNNKLSQFNFVRKMEFQKIDQFVTELADFLIEYQSFPDYESPTKLEKDLIQKLDSNEIFDNIFKSLNEEIISDINLENTDFTIFNLFLRPQVSKIHLKYLEYFSKYLKKYIVPIIDEKIEIISLIYTNYQQYSQHQNLDFKSFIKKYLYDTIESKSTDNFSKILEKIFKIDPKDRKTYPKEINEITQPYLDLESSISDLSNIYDFIILLITLNFNLTRRSISNITQLNTINISEELKIKIKEFIESQDQLITTKIEELNHQIKKLNNQKKNYELMREKKKIINWPWYFNIGFVIGLKDYNSTLKEIINKKENFDNFQTFVIDVETGRTVNNSALEPKDREQLIENLVDIYLKLDSNDQLIETKVTELQSIKDRLSELEYRKLIISNYLKDYDKEECGINLITKVLLPILQNAQNDGASLYIKYILIIILNHKLLDFFKLISKSELITLSEMEDLENILRTKFETSITFNDRGKVDNPSDKCILKDLQKKNNNFLEETQESRKRGYFTNMVQILNSKNIDIREKESWKQFYTQQLDLLKQQTEENKPNIILDSALKTLFKSRVNNLDSHKLLEITNKLGIDILDSQFLIFDNFISEQEDIIQQKNMVYVLLTFFQIRQNKNCSDTQIYNANDILNDGNKKRGVMDNLEEVKLKIYDNIPNILNNSSLLAFSIDRITTVQEINKISQHIIYEDSINNLRQIFEFRYQPDPFNYLKTQFQQLSDDPNTTILVSISVYLIYLHIQWRSIHSSSSQEVKYEDWNINVDLPTLEKLENLKPFFEQLIYATNTFLNGSPDCSSLSISKCLSFYKFVFEFQQGNDLCLDKAYLKNLIQKYKIKKNIKKTFEDYYSEFQKRGPNSIKEDEYETKLLKVDDALKKIEFLVENIPKIQEIKRQYDQVETDLTTFYGEELQKNRKLASQLEQKFTQENTRLEQEKIEEETTTTSKLQKSSRVVTELTPITKDLESKLTTKKSQLSSLDSNLLDQQHILTSLDDLTSAETIKSRGSTNFSSVGISEIDKEKAIAEATAMAKSLGQAEKKKSETRKIIDNLSREIQSLKTAISSIEELFNQKSRDLELNQNEVTKHTQYLSDIPNRYTRLKENNSEAFEKANQIVKENIQNFENPDFISEQIVKKKKEIEQESTKLINTSNQYLSSIYQYSQERIFDSNTINQFQIALENPDSYGTIRSNLQSLANNIGKQSPFYIDVKVKYQKYLLIRLYSQTYNQIFKDCYQDLTSIVENIKLIQDEFFNFIINLLYERPNTTLGDPLFSKSPDLQQLSDKLSSEPYYLEFIKRSSSSTNGAGIYKIRKAISKKSSINLLSKKKIGIKKTDTSIRLSEKQIKYHNKPNSHRLFKNKQLRLPKEKNSKKKIQPQDIYFQKNKTPKRNSSKSTIISRKNTLI